VEVYDPLSTRADPARPGQYLRDRFPGDRVPAARWDPVAKAALQYYPQPNAAGNPLTGADNFVGNPRLSPDNYDAIIARLDHHFTTTQRLFGRASWSKRFEGVDNWFGNLATAGSTGGRSARNLALDYINTISPRDLLNLRYGYTRYVDPYRPQSMGFDLTKLDFPASLRGQVVGMMFPEFSIAGLSTLGSASWTNPASDTHTFLGNFTNIRGPHTLKWGGDVRLIHRNEYSAGRPSGSFSFTRGFTQGPDPLRVTTTGGHAFASFLLGTPESGFVDNNVAPAYASLYFAGYLQEDYRVSRKLTLNLGLRYELEGARTERFNRMTRGFAWKERSPVQVPGLELYGGLLFAGVGGQPRSETATDYDNFAPRFGFAYALKTNMVLRGGYGIFWSGTSHLGFANIGFSAATPFIASLDGITPLNFLANPFPTGLLKPIGSTLGLATFIGQDVSLVDPSRRVPYTQQYSLSLQRQFSPSTLIEASYIGNRGIALASGTLSTNQIPDSAFSLGSTLVQQVPNPFYGIIGSGALASRTIARQVLLRPYIEFTDVRILSPMIGSATYHAFLLRAEKRFSRGISVLAGYTNSKLIDDLGSPYRHNLLRAERSLSSIDDPQRLVLSGIWDLPFGKGRFLGSSLSGALDKAISGWQVNWIATFQAGATLGVTRTLNSTGKSARLNHTNKDDMLRRYFDISAFSPAPPFTFGNVSRTLPDVRAPGTNNFDLSLMKSASLTDRVKLQLRGEFFNAWNRTEFGPPGTQYGTAQFGVINSISNSANPARQVQLGMKLTF
jgi:hypothetical protein